MPDHYEDNNEVLNVAYLNCLAGFGTRVNYLPGDVNVESWISKHFRTSQIRTI